MFETIGTLLMIAFWAVTIFLTVSSVILIFGKLTSPSGWDKFMAVVAMIAAAFTFYKTYDWLDSIPWSLLFTGCVVAIILGESTDRDRRPARREREYGLTDAIVDTYCEYELTKAAVKEAIRESKD